ncbi:MAG: hypothetical protein ACK5AK_08690, partial [Gemmatimonas sp.]
GATAGGGEAPGMTSGVPGGGAAPGITVGVPGGGSAPGIAIGTPAGGAVVIAAARRLLAEMIASFLPRAACFPVPAP